MTAAPISTLFQITPRYLRSANLERDFHDPKALDSYIVTPRAQACLSRLAAGLRPTSTQRAWRLTGDFGSGKSSFALFAAHWFAGEAARLTKSTGINVKYDRFSLTARPAYLPLLITGSAEPMGRAILRALGALIRQHYARSQKFQLQVRIEEALTQARVSDDDVLHLIDAANRRLMEDRKGSGLLILLDEMGKFLEYAAFHPESQDVYLLQRIAEHAARSAQSAPLFVIGILHQGFDAYSEQLDPAAQREWEKVAGRFEELLFDQPLLQISELIAAALKVHTSALPQFARREAKAGLQAAVRLGWLGRTPRSTSWEELATRVYPIHGTVIPPLVRLFSRFGQNERSLFSFLISDEPFSLRTFAHRPMAEGTCYRLPDLYDYVRANFGYRLSAHSYRSHWTQIESMVESFATSDAVEQAVVKTVGLLNLIDHPDLQPSETAVSACLSGPGGMLADEVAAAIVRLQKVRRVLFRRGLSGTFCLWPHTSVDLESAYERASKAIGTVSSVSSALEEFLESRPLVARRHYIETGTLRYFDVRYVPAAQIETVAESPSRADGRIIVALCETEQERATAVDLAQCSTFRTRKSVLVAVPKEPLVNQAGLVREVQRWDWIAANTEELKGDRFASEEVKRQREGARLRLTERVQNLIGLHSMNGAQALDWYCEGDPRQIASTRDLLREISTLCRKLFAQSPCVKNELLNRRTLSSAAAAARMRLVEGILMRPDQPSLGMDQTRKPPEMSMYLSVLRRGALHVKGRNGWRLDIPKLNDKEHDPLRLRPCLEAIRAYLEERPDKRVQVTEILLLLAAPPYGVRDGLALVLLAVYASVNSQELAFYEDGTFLREMSGNEFLRLSKVPDSFEVQLCRVVGVRAEVFEALLRVLEIKPHASNESLLLSVVKPLCDFVAALPDYARSTRRISPEAARVRDTIMTAHEPVKLLFADLPLACGVEPISPDGSASERQARTFSRRLKLYLDQLRNAFDALLERMQDAVCDEFCIEGTFDQVRLRLASRAEAVAIVASEPRVKALALRFLDTKLPVGPWLESLGSLLALQPPTRWTDAEEDVFRRELNGLVTRFKALEAIAFGNARSDAYSTAFRLSLTTNGGEEAQEVVFIDKRRVDDVRALASQIEELVFRDRVLGLAALSQVAWMTLRAATKKDDVTGKHDKSNDNE